MQLLTLFVKSVTYADENLPYRYASKSCMAAYIALTTYQSEVKSKQVALNTTMSLS